MAPFAQTAKTVVVSTRDLVWLFAPGCCAASVERHASDQPVSCRQSRDSRHVTLAAEPIPEDASGGVGQPEVASLIRPSAV
jgi:hypothetical protein